MKNTISRKDISKIHDVLQDQFKDSINLHQYEIHGALMALSKSRELIKLNMEKECPISSFIEKKMYDVRMSKKNLMSNDFNKNNDGVLISLHSKLELLHELKNWVEENEH